MVQAIWDRQGHLVDYVVLEANPALLQMLGFDRSVVGRRESQILRDAPPGWLRACERAMAGTPYSFEYHAHRSDRWFEIHLSRLSDDHLAQLVVEVTDRKWNERRTTEMFDELNHRVKNNLALVSAMLTMQARSAGSQEVRDQLVAAVDRVQTIADVHTSLYRSGRKDDVDFAPYLAALCERLTRSLLDRERISLVLEADPVVLPLDQAIPLGVVVNELVTNAAKHAYPPPAAGVITVRLESKADGLRLSVADSGPGLTGEPSPSGLGMRIVRSLVRQLGALLSVESRGGATFHVEMSVTAQSESDPAKQRALF